MTGGAEDGLNGDAKAVIDHVDTLFEGFDKRMLELQKLTGEGATAIAGISRDVKNQGREIGELKTATNDLRRKTEAFPGMIAQAIREHKHDCPVVVAPTVAPRGDEPSQVVPVPVGPVRPDVVPTASSSFLPSSTAVRYVILVGLFVGTMIAGIVIGSVVKANAPELGPTPPAAGTAARAEE